MTMFKPVLYALSIALLAGCASALPEKQPEAPPQFSDCADAESYYKARAGTLLVMPVGFEPHRILPPNAIVTMDYSPHRLNIYTDDKGIITDARCG